MCLKYPRKNQKKGVNTNERINNIKAFTAAKL